MHPAEAGPPRPNISPDPVTLDEATVGVGMGGVLRDLSAQLLDWTEAVREEARPEAIHQARVATRRLRSALSIFGRINPALKPLAADVRHCAAVLGTVRDWDVFLAGTGATMAATDDARAGSLIRAATRQRQAAATALAAYLLGTEFHRLAHALDNGATWDRSEASDTDALAASFPAFATDVLDRRLKRVRRRGRSLDELPTETLHELRKDCKRLRYAAECFAPAFPDRSAKRLLRRLAEVQAHLGTLNDAACCAALVAQLGRHGRGYAAGLAAGLALAAAQPARQQVSGSWKRFRKVAPFWR